VIFAIRYLTYAQWLPGHANSAIRLLTLLVSNPASHSQLMLVLSTAPQSKLSKHAIVDVLDFSGTVQDPYDLKKDGTELLAQIKEGVVDFLAQSLVFPAPTVAHVLLGYDTSGRGIRHTLLQHPGTILQSLKNSF